MTTLIPDELDTPEFRAKWAEWLKYRSSTRRKVSPLACRQQLTRLACFGPEIAIEAIDSSISNDYQGLFPRAKRDAKGRPLWAIDKRMREIEKDTYLLGPGGDDNPLYQEYLGLLAERRKLTE